MGNSIPKNQSVPVESIKLPNQKDEDSKWANVEKGFHKIDPSQRLNHFPHAVLRHISSYLDSKSQFQLRQVDRSFKAFAVKNDSTLYKTSCRFLSEEPSASSMLQARLDLVQDQLSRLAAIREISSMVNCYCKHHPQGGVIGILSDMIMIEDPEIARALSTKRWNAMSLIVCVDTFTPNDFRKTMNTKRPLAFLPVDAACAGRFYDELQTASSFDTLPEIDSPGFLGYAVKLIKLRPEHETLRSSVLWTIFRGLMIFDTAENAKKYENGDGWWLSLDCSVHSPKYRSCHFMLPSREFVPLSQDIDVHNQMNILSKKANSLRHSLAHLLYSKDHK